MEEFNKSNLAGMAEARASIQVHYNPGRFVILACLLHKMEPCAFGIPDLLQDSQIVVSFNIPHLSSLCLSETAF